MLHQLPLSTLLLISSITTSFAAPASSSSAASSATPTPPPLLIWHGLGDNYAADGLHSVGDLANATNPGTYVYYIRLDDDPGTDRTATFLGNLTEQIAQVCADVANHEILSKAQHGVNALGFSQGGQFLRAFVERCNVPRVRNLVTFGSQHNGITRYQSCGPRDWLCRAWIGLLKSNTWGAWVQSHLVPAQYFRAANDSTGEPSEEYLENSNFLADINNERPGARNETYRRNLASLESFTMFVFGNDTTVVPKESGWFAQVNESSGEVTGLRERRLYKEDWLGLRELDERGKLRFEVMEGAAHMEIDEEVLEGVFREYFGVGGNGEEGEENMEL